MYDESKFGAVPFEIGIALITLGLRSTHCRAHLMCLTKTGTNDEMRIIKAAVCRAMITQLDVYDLFIISEASASHSSVIKSH